VGGNANFLGMEQADRAEYWAGSQEILDTLRLR